MNLYVVLKYFKCDSSSGPPGGNQVCGLPPAPSGVSNTYRREMTRRGGMCLVPCHDRRVIPQQGSKQKIGWYAYLFFSKFSVLNKIIFLHSFTFKLLILIQLSNINLSMLYY